MKQAGSAFWKGDAFFRELVETSGAERWLEGATAYRTTQPK